MKLSTAKILRAYILTVIFIILIAIAVIGTLTVRNNSDYMSQGISVPTIILQKNDDGVALVRDKKVFVRLGGITR